MDREEEKRMDKQMTRRDALRLLFAGTAAMIFADGVFSKVAGEEGVTWDEKGEMVGAKSGMLLNTTPSKELKFDFGENFDTLTVAWRGKVKTIKMQEVWDAL